ncbi:heavy metal-associated isoprenylated plant protein 37-like isoform X2 [Telopea speciosissima]|uniref:heavy metal-associated isoprenylated plant protein 37-like isoform X1 n=1 Tax=Telopea speciosissima TaxID=54955 RepID=UPI001CC53802|nr:heavy metal-associated isoprenylated plant protein 37-like isoform X1 [Telopea speciosissima]XP_043695363.1 heavy metal-associated isoprenylated plant protein 37-like isoform X2 [Telopea speciosissima]
MTKDEDFKLLKIQTCVLKVNIHCDGCKQKVKKLLQKIEGVLKVNIDAEQQKVTVSGSVDPATLIKKLMRSGKHAELWSAKSNHNQKQQQQAHCIKDNKNGQNQKQGLMKGLQAFKNQHKHPAFSSEDDEFDCDDDDDDEDDFEEELRLFQQKANHMGLLNQQANMVANAKKNGSGATHNNGKMNNGGNGQAGKKGGGGNGGGNPNQNMGMDQKVMAAAAAKMNNAHLNGGHVNAGEAKKGNEITAMLAGLNGHGAGVGLGGNGLGFQAQMNNGFQGSSAGFPAAAAAAGYAAGGHQPSAMMNNLQGYQFNHPSVMNMQNRNNMNLMMNEAKYMQPQMMYNRSPSIAPSTGYYYNNYYTPFPYPSSQPDNNGADSAAHMFSDENPNSCVVM